MDKRLDKNKSYTIDHDHAGMCSSSYSFASYRRFYLLFPLYLSLVARFSSFRSSFLSAFNDVAIVWHLNRCNTYNALTLPFHLLSPARQPVAVPYMQVLLHLLFKFTLFQLLEWFSWPERMALSGGRFLWPLSNLMRRSIRWQPVLLLLILWYPLIVCCTPRQMQSDTTGHDWHNRIACPSYWFPSSMRSYV